MLLFISFYLFKRFFFLNNAAIRHDTSMRIIPALRTHRQEIASCLRLPGAMYCEFQASQAYVVKPYLTVMVHAFNTSTQEAEAS